MEYFDTEAAAAAARVKHHHSTSLAHLLRRCSPHRSLRERMQICARQPHTSSRIYVECARAHKPDRFYIMSAGAPMMLTLCARKCAHTNTENKPTLSIRSRSMRRCRSSCDDNDNRVMHATYTQIAGSLVLAVAGRGLVSG